MHNSVQKVQTLKKQFILYSSFPPSIGLASLIASPLLGPSPAAMVAAATSSRNGSTPSGSSGQSFVPSNTCAKCGVTFRMTSDLVYHMRTHHAKETSETRYNFYNHNNDFYFY